jgi:hypothetical protein
VGSPCPRSGWIAAFLSSPLYWQFPKTNKRAIKCV